MMKDDPLNPPKGDFGPVQLWQDTTRLTPLHQLAGGWEGS